MGQTKVRAENQRADPTREPTFIHSSPQTDEGFRHAADWFLFPLSLAHVITACTCQRVVNGGKQVVGAICSRQQKLEASSVCQ